MRLSFALLFVALAACSSGGLQTPAVTVHVEQISQSELHFGGPVNVQFDVLVTNVSNAPLTLRRIELRTVGSGAYTLRNDSTPLNLTIAPGQTASRTITAAGWARGGNLSSEEPVTLRAIAYFDGPTGSFVRMVSQNISQGNR